MRYPKIEDRLGENVFFLKNGHMINRSFLALIICCRYVDNVSGEIKLANVPENKYDLLEDCQDELEDCGREVIRRTSTTKQLMTEALAVVDKHFPDLK